MDRTLADLAAQEAELLPTRITLWSYGNQPYYGPFGVVLFPLPHCSNVHTLDLGIGSGGPEPAIQSIHVR
ncbi:hypothetical protein [Amycolatopsis taiwanensis]|uniref:Uncharacterized protein n=1 Tax=Amycolatopsis taiwanensis TaxID=342230 RepID=A0A9W6QXP1_9PSEU|nr:hypothetical protein [Amycolatopsis taiwanensis]GLY65929.1 hypothetical protein Atai01_25480 [Amycolatopsis taiwanensis]